MNASLEICLFYSRPACSKGIMRASFKSVAWMPVEAPPESRSALPPRGAAATQATLASSASFARDRLTWLSFLLYGFWSLAWGLFSPIMPFLRGELKLTYSVAALHFSALAAGVLIAGLTGSRIVTKFSPVRTISLGTAAVALAVVSLIAAVNHYLTIFAALTVGFAGSIAAQSIIASLCDRFPLQRTAVIAELVLVTTLFSASAPLVVAAVLTLGLPWKFALIIPPVVLALILVVTRCGGGKVWARGQLTSASKRRLPNEYFKYFAIIFLCVAAEWSISFWCPDYLEHTLHLRRADACAGLSIFLFAMFTGRLLGRKLAGSTSANRLLAVATVLAATGFFLFWCAHATVAVFAGLIVLGLGEANCYPFALAAAINAAEGKTAEATAGMSVSTGTAILVAPFFLGVAADHVGITHAYAIVGALLVMAAATSCWVAIRGSRTRGQKTHFA